jgi:hypothetical protein
MRWRFERCGAISKIPRCRSLRRSASLSYPLSAITRSGFCRGRPPQCRRPARSAASVVSASRTSDGDAEQRWSPKGIPRPSTTTIHFVPLPRLVFPTSAPLFSPGRNCRPGTTRSSSTVGVSSTRSGTRARCSTRRPARPSPAASRLKGADIFPACPANERRSAESRESLPTHDGSRSTGDRPGGACAVWGARARFSSTALRSTTDRIAPSALLRRC